MAEWKREPFSFPSTDGVHEIYATLSLPEGEPRGVVQLIHGMLDHSARYGELANAVLEAGFAFVGMDLPGHGDSVKDPEERGFFSEGDGIELLLGDILRCNERIHARFPHLPVVIFAHSMGSFLGRMYAERYGDTVSGIVLSGTAGRLPAATFGIGLTRLLALFRGKRYRSPFVAKMAFAGYLSRFSKEEGVSAWITRDGEIRKTRDADLKSQFIFTVSGYRDLFRMVRHVGSRSHFAGYPKTLPTLLVAGTMDPVGKWGEGVRQVYSRLGDAGVSPLDILLYEGARHEVFSEIDREEFFSDLTKWLREAILLQGTEMAENAVEAKETEDA